MLIRIENPPEGEKCAHPDGRWVAVIDGDAFGFDPPTQLQKDIWVSEPDPEEPGAKTREGRIEQLRWLCFRCGTIQLP